MMEKRLKYLMTFYLSLLIFTCSYSQKLTCKSGNCYDGYGEIVHGENGTYVGEFEKGKMSGLGTYIGKLSMFRGEFKNNDFHGLGSLIIFEEFKGHPMTTIEFSGHWKNGKKHGMIKVDDYLNEVEKWCVYMNDELKEVLYEFDRSVKK